MLNAYVAAVSAGVTQASCRQGSQVTFLANTNGGGLTWSPDGSYLMLASSMRLEPAIIARVDLVPRVPKMREDQFTALFRDQTPGRGLPTPPVEPPPTVPNDSTTRSEPRTNRGGVRVVFDGIQDRLTVLPTGLEVDALSMSRDGKNAAARCQYRGTAEHLHLLARRDDDDSCRRASAHIDGGTQEQRAMGA
jgi:hypothetical protein